MRQLILEKLSKLLKSGIDTEAKTLYLFAEIRKIRKLDGVRKTDLDFFRDWVVHEELTERGADFFLKELKLYVTDSSDTKTIANDFKLRENDFFKFVNLRTKLRDFFIVNNLPSDLTDDTGYWWKFIRLLVEILKECPIKCKEGKIDTLSLREDNSGNICFRFHLRGRKEVIKMKLKIKGLERN